MINNNFESAEEFVRLRTSDDMIEYDMAAQGEATEAIWLEVIRKYPNMRFWVAHNKTVPIEILEILANDEDRKVRGMVAAKRKATRSILEKLAADPCESVRIDVLCNAKVPLDIIEQLQNDPVPRVAETAREKYEERKNKG